MPQTRQSDSDALERGVTVSRLGAKKAGSSSRTIRIAHAQETSDESTNCKIHKVKRPVGHPPCYTPEIAAEICRRLAGGEYLVEICSDDGMPSDTTINSWVAENHEGFFTAYMRARRANALARLDRNDRIAADATPENVRVAELQIKNNQWVMERVYQQIFGTKFDVTSDQKPLAGADSRAAAAALLAQAAELRARVSEGK